MKKQKWNEHEKAEFLKRIGLLMKRGYSLANSLELYAFNEREEIRMHIHNILERLKNGERIYEILQQLEFPSDIVASLYFFEKNDLAEGLIHSGEFLAKRVAFKHKLQKILQYPLFLLWLTSIMIYLLFRHLIPHFSNLYSSIGSTLPKASQLIILTVKTLPFLFIIAGTLFILFIFAQYVKFRRLSPRTKLLNLLRYPVIRTLTKLFVTHRFSLNLSSLLQSGVSINEAMQIFEQQTYSPFLQQEASEIKHRLVSGESLEQIMNERNPYRKELSQIIKHGQISGNLADELAIYADLLFQKIEQYLTKTLTIIQPIIFTIVGLIVLLMFLAIMLPMLQFIQSL